jgi:hypothetical protein
MQKTQTFILLVLLSLGQTAFGNSTKQSLSWNIKHTSWSPEHYKLYEEFISTIGNSKEKSVCHTTNDCLKSPIANPLYSSKNPRGLKNIFSDCADLPFILMAYFSWMNELPFTYPVAVQVKNRKVMALQKELAVAKLGLKRLENTPYYYSKKALKKERKRLYKSIKKINKKIRKARRKRGWFFRPEDVRYSAEGNMLVRKKIVKQGDSINNILDSIVISTSTATYRINPTDHQSGPIMSDFYSPKLDRSTIRPGTVLYDSNGHIAVVYKVEKNGRIKLIDAHPDNSLTSISFGKKFARSHPSHGAGFINWRPFDYNQGEFTHTPNDQIDDFSMVQYLGTTSVSQNEWTKAKYFKDGEEMDYYTFLRASLSLGELKYYPLKEYSEILKDICSDFKDRRKSVQLAIASKIDQKAQPSKLPKNIYGTEGEWETYSTPSRDARIKSSVEEAYQFIIEMLEKEKSGDPKLIYHGTNLSSDLKSVYSKMASQCQIGYKNSAGAEVTLNLDKALERLFKLSFDPYHCPELRWGATSDSELSTCQMDKTKWKWYKAEQGLRNRIERDYSLPMDKTLGELPYTSIIVKKVPQINMKELLNSL